MTIGLGRGCSRTNRPQFGMHDNGAISGILEAIHSEF